MTTVMVIAGVVLLISTALAVYRLLRGPSTLDRLVAIEMVMALVLCGLGTWAAYTKDSTVVPAIVALALLGFIGSISVVRFRVRDKS